MKLLCVLQNAHTRYAERLSFDIRNVSYRAYLFALSHSHTGKRLQAMLPVSLEDVVIINASPTLTLKSSECPKPDHSYIAKAIEECQPDMVLTFGSVADAALTVMNVEHLAFPHPASRRLSKQQIIEINSTIKHMMTQV